VELEVEPNFKTGLNEEDEIDFTGDDSELLRRIEGIFGGSGAVEDLLTSGDDDDVDEFR
jgi:hypothetical protein